MRTLFTLALLLLAVPAALAQTLSGVITEAVSGDTLPGAIVEILNQPTPLGDVTDIDGRYRIALPANGRYRVLVSSQGGLRSSLFLIRVVGDRVLNVALVEAEELPEVNVVGAVGRIQATWAPVTVSGTSAVHIAEQPAAKDLAVTLAAEPSVTTYSESGHGLGYTTLRLRGFDERRLAVTINGQPMNDPEDHAVYWLNFMDLQPSIRDVEIQRGAGSAVYGTSGIGGAVNIVVDPFSVDRSVSVEGGVGAFGTRSASAEVQTGSTLGRGVRAFARVTRLASDGYRCHSWARFTRVTAGVEVIPGSDYDHRITVLGFGGPQHDALAYYGIEKAANEQESRDCADDTQRRYNYGAVSGDVERFSQPFLTASHVWSVRNGLRVEQTLYGTRGVGFFDFDGTFRSADYLRLPAGAGGIADRSAPLYDAAPGAALTFRAYVDNQRIGYLPRVVMERGTSRVVVGADLLAHRSLHWGRIEATTLAGTPSGDAAPKSYSYRGGKEHAAVYISALDRPSDRIAVQADLSVRALRYRLRDEAYFGQSFAVPYVFVNPRLGATVNPVGRTRGYASVAFAQREARLKNFYDAEEAGSGAEPFFARRTDGSFDFARPFVRPETAVNLELGAVHVAALWRAGVTGYAYLFRDEIVASGGLDAYGVPRTGNAARTRHVGLEVEATGFLPGRPWVSASASATVSDDRFIRFDEFDDAGQPVSRDGNRIALFPAASARAELRYEQPTNGVGRYGGRLGLRVQGVQPTTNAGTADRAAVLDAYALADASVWAERWFSGGSLRASLDLNNAFDARVLGGGNSGGFFPVARRHVFVSLRYTLGERSVLID